MRVLLTNTFKRFTKKIPRNQIAIVEKAIDKIKHNPTLGDLKIGDLVGIKVYKFHILHQLYLMAYLFEEKNNDPSITLLALAFHENFYQDLKKQLKN